MARRPLPNIALRTLSAIFLAPVFVTALWHGFPYANALLALIATYLALEWVAMIRHQHMSTTGGLLAATGAFIMGSIDIVGAPNALIFALFAGVPAMLFSLHLSREKCLELLFAGPYLFAPLVCLSWATIQAPQATEHMIWLLGSVWLTDIFAYLGGRLFGGPKLVVRISPNKTWSGAICGLLAALGFGYGLAGHYQLELNNMLFLTGLLSIATIAGDLFESAIKRFFDVKDSGTIIPGHGGMLDRMDGLLPASALMAYYIISEWTPFLNF